MSSAPLTNEKMSYLKQMTNPLWSLLLAPISYSLLGFVLAFKASITSWSNLWVVFLFLLLLNFQEFFLAKFYRVPKKNQITVLVISNLLLAFPIFYIIQASNFRLGLLTLLIVLMNHVKILPITTQYSAYVYQLLLNSFTKFALGNSVTYYLLVGHIPSTIFYICLSFSLLGIYVAHTKQKIENQKKNMTIAESNLAKTINTVLNLSWLWSTIVVLFTLNNHYSFIALVILGLTLLIPLLFQIVFKRQLKGNHVVTYYYWYMIVLAFLLAIFYQ